MALENLAKNSMLVELGAQALYVGLLDVNSQIIPSSKALTWGSTAGGSPTGRQIDITGTYEWDVAQGVWPRYIVIAKDSGLTQRLSGQESTGVSEAYATAGTLTLTNFTVTLLQVIV